MFIKTLILDGFKSYGKRIEINDFDREFTAITGLNGTGKSNILDSICFVLGITNLSQVGYYYFNYGNRKHCVLSCNFMQAFLILCVIFIGTCNIFARFSF